MSEDTLTGASVAPQRVGRRAHLPVRRLLLAVAGAVLLLAGWQATAAIYDLPSIVLPTPLAVARQLGALFQEASFWHDLAVSMSEFGCGFAAGIVLGVLVGLAMSEMRALGMTIHPVLESLRFVVPFAWIPLAVLWFGTSFWGKAFLVTYAVFFVMVVSTVGMLRQVDPVLSRVGIMLGMSRVRLALAVRLRAVAPGMASSCRAAAAIGWIAVVAAEYVGSSAGVGFLVINAEQSLQTPVVIAGMVVIGCVGALLSAAIGLVSRRWLSYS